MADESRRSPERALALLASFPIPEHDFDAQAAAIEARLRDVLPGSTEARWLEAPLPDQPGEGSAAATEPVPAPPGISAIPERPAPEAAPPAAARSAPSEDAPLQVHSSEAIAPQVGVPEAVLSADLASSAESAAKPARASTPAPSRTRGGASSAPPPPPPSSSGGQSLAALARSVAHKGPRPQSHDLAKESLSVAAAARAHTDSIVERVRGSRSDPAPGTSSRRSSGAPSPALPAPGVGASPAVPSQPPRARDLRGPWLAVAAIGFAAAAAIFFMGRSREAAPMSPVAQQPAEAAARTESPASVAAAKVARAPVETVPAAPSEAGSATAPMEEALPSAVTAAEQTGTANLAPHSAAARPLAARTAASGIASQQPTTPPKKASSSVSAARPAPEAVVLDETPGRTAKQSAPASAETALRPASGAPSGGLPDKPATGAVQAALGSVMGPARACLAGSTAAAPAQVTFGSDGSVKAASVTGPTAGSPAAACIEAALQRARVAPFAAESFSLGVWVRP